MEKFWGNERMKGRVRVLYYVSFHVRRHVIMCVSARHLVSFEVPDWLLQNS